MGDSSTPRGNSTNAEFRTGQQFHKDDGADETENAGHTQTVSILVFKGHPRDTQSTRRADFYIVASDKDKTNTTFRLEGQPGVYWVSETPSLGAPHLRTHFRRPFHVATVQTSSATDTTLRDAIIGTPVRNDDPEYGRLNWVEDVVVGLQNSGLIPADEGTLAVDAAINEILHAPEP
jgi:hypothetical protein